MKRLKSWGSSKSSGKAEAAAKAANQSSSGQWPTVSTVPEEQPAVQGSQQQAQRQAAPSDTYVNFSDDDQGHGGVSPGVCHTAVAATGEQVAHSMFNSCVRPGFDFLQIV